jgi:hypothetical protein
VLSQCKDKSRIQYRRAELGHLVKRGLLSSYVESTVELEGPYPKVAFFMSVNTWLVFDSAVWKLVKYDKVPGQH